MIVYVEPLVVVAGENTACILRAPAVCFLSGKEKEAV